MKQLTLLTLLLLPNFFQVKAQPTYLDVGLSARLTCEFTTWCNQRLKTNISLGVGASFAIRNPFSFPNYRPTMSAEFILINGRPGSRDYMFDFKEEKKMRKSKTNAFMAITCSPLKFGFYSFSDSDSALSQFNKPEYYFFDFTPNVMTNPFKGSINFGTSFVYNFDASGRGYHAWQRIALITGNVGPLTVHYLNDGALAKPFCDMRDRWFTGGLIFNYFNSKALGPFNSIELSYMRFTGWTDQSYEVARDMQFAETPYKDPDQHQYNKGEYVLRFSNTQKGFGVGICAYDIFRYDLQNLIHLKRYFSYHINHFPSQVGLNIYGDFNQTY